MIITTAENQKIIQICEYLHPKFTHHIAKEAVEIIFEIGSRDGMDALALRDYYNAKVYAVECNPEGLAMMRKNLGSLSDIEIIAAAAWDKNEIIPFYPVTATTMFGKGINKNIGASSCFKARLDYIQKYTQCEIEVEAMRLEDYCKRKKIERIDMICMDVQGAALHVLKGLGNILHQTNYLIVELERKKIYYGQDMFGEVCDYLQEYNFKIFVERFRDPWFSDFLFIKK